MLVWQLLWGTFEPRYFELRYFEFLPIKEILCIEISLIDSNVSLPHIMNFYLISSFKSLGGCDGLERTDFEQFLLWEGVVVMKELIFNYFYFGRVWWSWKNLFLTVFLLWNSVVVMKELILNSFYFGRVWWSWKNWFLTVSILGGCGGLERTDF